MSLGVIASGDARTEFVDINVASWAWLATIGVIVALLLFDILILNRHAHAPTLRRAAIAIRRRSRGSRHSLSTYVARSSPSPGR